MSGEREYEVEWRNKIGKVSARSARQAAFRAADRTRHSDRGQFDVFMVTDDDGEEREFWLKIGGAA